MRNYFSEPLLKKMFLSGLLFVTFPLFSAKDFDTAAGDYIARVQKLITDNTADEEGGAPPSESAPKLRAEKIAIAQQQIAALSVNPAPEDRTKIQQLSAAIKVLASVGRKTEDYDTVAPVRKSAIRIIDFHNRNDEAEEFPADDVATISKFPPSGVRVFSVLVSPAGKAQAALEQEISEKKAAQKLLTNEVSVSPRAQSLKTYDLAQLEEEIAELEQKRGELRKQAATEKESLSALTTQLQVATKDFRRQEQVAPFSQQPAEDDSKDGDARRPLLHSSTGESVGETFSTDGGFNDLDRQIKALQASDKSTLTASQKRALALEVERLQGLAQRLQTPPYFDRLDKIRQAQIERDQKAALETIEDDDAFTSSDAVRNNLRREMTADFNAMQFADPSDPEFRKKNEGLKKLFARLNPADQNFDNFHAKTFTDLREFKYEIETKMTPGETLSQFAQRMDGEELATITKDNENWYKQKLTEMVESGISLDDLDRAMKSSRATQFLDEQVAKTQRLNTPSALDVFKAKITGTGYAQFMRERAQQRAQVKKEAAETAKTLTARETKDRLQAAREKVFAEISAAAIEAAPDKNRHDELQAAANRMDTSVFLTKQADVDDFVARTKEVLEEEDPSRTTAVRESFTDMSDDEFRSKLFPELAAQEAELAKIKAPRVRDAKRLAIMKNSLMGQLRDRSSPQLFFSDEATQLYNGSLDIGNGNSENLRKEIMATRAQTAAVVAARENLTIADIKEAITAGEISAEKGNQAIADERLRVKMLADAEEKASRDTTPEFAALRDEFSQLTNDTDETTAEALRRKMIAHIMTIKGDPVYESLDDLESRTGKILYLKNKIDELKRSFKLTTLPDTEKSFLTTLEENLSAQLVQKLKAQQQEADSESKELQAIDTLAQQYARETGDMSEESPLQRAAKESKSRKAAIERDHEERLRALLDAHNIPAASYANLKLLTQKQAALERLTSPSASTAGSRKRIADLEAAISKLQPAVDLLKAQQAGFIEQEKNEQLRYADELKLETATYQSTVEKIKTDTLSKLSEDTVQKHITTSEELEALEAQRARATIPRVQETLDAQIVAKKTRLAEIESQLDNPSALREIDPEGFYKKPLLRTKDTTSYEQREITGDTTAQQKPIPRFGDTPETTDGSASAAKGSSDQTGGARRPLRVEIPGSPDSASSEGDQGAPPAAARRNSVPQAPPPPPPPPGSAEEEAAAAKKTAVAQNLINLLERAKAAQKESLMKKELEDAARARGEISKKETAEYLVKKKGEYDQLSAEQLQQRAVKYATKDEIKGKRFVPNWFARMIKSSRTGRFADDNKTVSPEKLLQMRLRAQARKDIRQAAKADGEAVDEKEITKQLFKTKDPQLLAAQNRQLQLLLSSDDSDNTSHGGNPAGRAFFYETGNLGNESSLLRDGQPINLLEKPTPKKSLIQRLTPKRWSKGAQR